MAITQEQLLAACHKVATLSDEEVKQLLLTGYTKKIASSKNLKRALLGTVLATAAGGLGLGVKGAYDILSVLSDTMANIPVIEDPSDKLNFNYTK